MALVFNFQAMERHGDVVAEIKNFNSSSCALIGNSFKSGKYKMCKDEIVAPLFCSASDCISKGIVMSSENKSVKRYLNSDEAKVHLFSPQKNYVSEDLNNMPVIESSVNYKSDSPTWDKPPMLQSYSPEKDEKIAIQKPFINGSKFLIASKNVRKENVNESLKEKSSLNLKENDTSNALLDYDAETSSSSIEEVYCLPGKECVSEKINELLQGFERDSNSNIDLKPHADETKKENDPVLSSLSSPKLSDSVSKDNTPNSDSPTKSDRVMPELLPTLICLDDDDDPIVTDSKKKQCEVVNVVDSPEMPTLVPFTSEMEEAFRIKTELLSDDDDGVKDTNHQLSGDEIRQPQILLQRLSVNQSDDPKVNIKSILSFSAKKARQCIYESPEIEEIEGVRFFQFRSKQDMEDFNRIRLEKAETDEDMIVPTKTTDITQIKGWRTKYFAPESQFQHQPFILDLIKKDDSNQDNKISTHHVNDDKDKKCSSDCLEMESKKHEISKCDLNESKSVCNNSALKEENESQIQVKALKEDIKNPMSAFVSDELDKYLLESSKLNISLLQKVNPNIIPISPDASILSIGKLRKTDYPFTPIKSLKRKREFLPLEKVESDTSESLINLTDSPGSPNVVVLDSSEESSSEEDIPVAKLTKPKKKVMVRNRTLTNVLKTQNNDYELTKSLERAAKRVVLRLTKDGDGVSKGYKVADISCNKKPHLSSHPSTPPSPEIVHDPIKMLPDGSLPVIKQTLFSKKSEPNLLDEFINNLNMYGTRKDVAMLVQSNQSCFDEGPILSRKICKKTVSALVSNKLFLDNKQKLKKRKLKTWQKYLPKKLSDKQKMKLTKRKTRVQSLLDDAGDILSAERGKRSIRLPARYLDSAVLAASEWVSPTITLEENPPGKTKQLIDITEKKNDVVDRKSKALSSSSSESESSTSSESSSDSSDSDDNAPLLEVPQKRPNSIRKTPVKRRKVDSQCKASPKLNNSKTILKTDIERKSAKKEPTPLLKKSTNSIKDLTSVPKKTNTLKNNLVTAADQLKDIVSNNQSSVSKENSTAFVNKSDINENHIASKENCAVFVNSKKYLLPNCSCKHCSRTAAFDNKNKFFFCNLCYATQKLRLPNGKAKKSSKVKCVEGKKTELNQNEISVEKELKDNSINQIVEDDSLKKESKANSISKDKEGSVWSDSNILVNYSMDNLLKLDDEKCNPKDEKHSHVVKADNSSIDSKKMSDELGQNKLPSPPKLSAPVLVNSEKATIDPVFKQDKHLKLTNENINIPAISTPNNVGGKYILLLAPVKSVGNVNNVANKASIPLLPGINTDKTDKMNDNQKSKNPILIRKTATGFISSNTAHEASNTVSPLGKNVPSNKTVSLSLPFNNQDSINSTSASFKLSKLTEKSVSKHEISPSVAPDINIKISPSVASDNNIKISAVKQGSNYNVSYKFVVVPNKDTNSVSFSNTIVTPTVVQDLSTKGPIISSVQSIQSDRLGKSGEPISNGYSEVLSNSLTKVSLPSIKQDTKITESETLENKTSSHVVEPQKLNDKCYEQITETKTLNAILNDHESYHKKKPKNRRKSPLLKIYNDDDNGSFIFDNEKTQTNPELDKELDIEVDVDTIDTAFNALSELRRDIVNNALAEVHQIAESDSEISDAECANIFNSTADSLVSIYSKKNVKERQRRFLIKSGFEKLKASSKHFKNAKSCIEILQMALFVIHSQKKKDRIFDLAKKRLKCHNTMLMGKLMKLLDGIETPNVRKKIKKQVIKDLAFDRKKFKYPKTALPLLSEGYKGTISNSNTERNKSSTDASDIAVKKQQQKQNLHLADSSLSVPAETSTLAKSGNYAAVKKQQQKQNSHLADSNLSVSAENLSETSTLAKSELKKLLTMPPASGIALSQEKVLESPPKQASPNSSEGKKQILLQKEGKEGNSGSDTEELVSEGKNSGASDDDDIEICESSKVDVPNAKSPPKTNNSLGSLDSDGGQTNYPGLIHLFHPKVFKENFSMSELSTNSEVSSQRGEISNIRNRRQSVGADSHAVQSTSPKAGSQDNNDDDDDISIIGSNVPLASANSFPVPLHSPPSTNEELIKAAYSANKQYGPCTVQKVQLKSGKMVFAYTPEVPGSSSANSNSTTSPLSQNVNDVQMLDETISASQNSTDKKQKTVPEEIVLSDSEDESDNKQSASVTASSSVSSSNLDVPIQKRTPESYSERMQVDEPDSDDDSMYIDESDSQNANGSNL